MIFPGYLDNHLLEGSVQLYVLPSEKKGWKAMATNSSGIARLIPKSQCIPWIIVLIMESLSVVILNLLMVIVFAKHRQLQRRGTYLLIRNLAIVDLLAGGISGPLQIERINLGDCDIWELDETAFRLDWKLCLKFALLNFFQFVSIANLVAIFFRENARNIMPFKASFLEKMGLSNYNSCHLGNGRHQRGYSDCTDDTWTS